MAAPLVVAQAAPVALQSAVKVLSTDIVRLEGKFYRRFRVKEPRRDPDGSLTFTKTGRMRMHTIERLEPIDVSLHANPIGFGVLAITGAVAAMALFGRVVLPGQSASFGPFSVSIPQTELYKGPLADEFQAFKDDWKSQRTFLPGERTEEEIEQERQRSDCLKSHHRHNYLKRQGRDAEAAVVKREAAAAGCLWAT